MRKEKRIYKINVGHLEGKDVKEYMKDIENIVKGVKNVTTMGPGIVYAPYIPMNTDAIIESYVPKQKILKVKEWLRFHRYGQKVINNNFYRTISAGDNNIPEVNLKMESRTIEGGALKKIGTEWKAIAEIEKGGLSELTEDELAFNNISEKLKKIGL
jgi:hypothetical protein